MAASRASASKRSAKGGAKTATAKDGTTQTFPSAEEGLERLAHGRSHWATFPAAPSRAELPGNYLATLTDIRRRIHEERLRVVVAANAAMVGLYWDIGRLILDRQSNAGWGAKVIDRLSADLRDTYPDMQGFSPRNLEYMRAFAAAWPEFEVVQAALARITWYHNIALLERLDDSETRLWYAKQTVQHGWSRNVLVVQIDSRAHQRHGKAISNFTETLHSAKTSVAASPH